MNQQMVLVAVLCTLLLLGGCINSPGISDNNSTESDTPTPSPTDTEEEESSRSSSVNLKSTYNPPCDPEEDLFLKIIELNGDGSYDESTEVVLENQLNTKAYVDHIAVYHGDVGTKTLVYKEFWIPARGVDAFTVDVPPEEIDGVKLSTDEPWAHDVGCS